MWASARRVNPERRTKAVARNDFIVVCRVWVVVERRKCSTRKGRVVAKRFCGESAGKSREA